MKKSTNEFGPHYVEVTPETPFEDMEFHNDEGFPMDTLARLVTNMGNFTVLDRLTGYGYRDVETGYLDPEGRFWLASGVRDVRYSGASTMQEAIDWVKGNANTCVDVRRDG